MALMDLAFLQLRYGDYQRARANAERAYANNRHCPKILSRAGTVLFFLGDKRGLDLVNRALETESDPAAWFYVAPFYDALEIGRATSELQSLMRISYAVFCLKKTTTNNS